MQERTKIEEAYGQALVKQARWSPARSSAAPAGWGCTPSRRRPSRSARSTSSWRRTTTDCTALQYLRDKQANAHKGLANECAGFVADARKATSGLAKARARCAELSKKLDAALLVQPDGQPPPPPQQALAKELELAYAAANEAVRGTQLQAGQMCAKLPKLLADFEKGEGQRIDSLKMALKKLCSAHEATLAAQRPILYAAADMVDAIAHSEDLASFVQDDLRCAPTIEDLAATVDEQGQQLRLLDGQHAALVAAAPPAVADGGGGADGGGARTPSMVVGTPGVVGAGPPPSPPRRRRRQCRRSRRG